MKVHKCTFSILLYFARVGAASTLACLIAEQGLIREQDGIFLRIAKGVGPNKRAGYSEHGIFSNLSLQEKN